jgi:DNA-directed RNA polymerase sigma subunit (sigma70/sigma32)
MIPTWAERCEKFGNEIVTNAMIQHEVAEIMQITRSKVNTIEKKALRKLKYIITRKYKKEDLL